MIEIERTFLVTDPGQFTVEAVGPMSVRFTVRELDGRPRQPWEIASCDSKLTHTRTYKMSADEFFATYPRVGRGEPFHVTLGRSDRVPRSLTIENADDAREVVEDCVRVPGVPAEVPVSRDDRHEVHHHVRRGHDEVNDINILEWVTSGADAVTYEAEGEYAKAVEAGRIGLPRVVSDTKD